MPAYVVVEHIITDAAKFEAYRTKVGPEALNAWYTSPEYQPLLALRKQCTSELDMLITLEGV